MGNDGVHDIDYAWLGLHCCTSESNCCGGEHFFDDDQQFPDTQHVLFEYDGEGGFGNQENPDL